LRFLRRPAQPGSRVQPTTPLPLSELDRTVANPIVRSLAIIFMLRCDRSPVMLTWFHQLTPGHALPRQPMVVISLDEIICTIYTPRDAGTKLSGSGKFIRLALNLLPFAESSS
jgi:hypothetical protein